MRFTAKKRSVLNAKFLPSLREGVNSRTYVRKMDG